MGLRFFTKADKGTDSFIGRCICHVCFDPFCPRTMSQATLRELCLQFIEQGIELLLGQPSLDTL